MKLVAWCFVLIGFTCIGCRHTHTADEASTGGPRTVLTKEKLGYMNEDLTVQAEVKIDTSAFRKKIHEMCSPADLLKQLGSGYQNLYMKLTITKTNQVSFSFFPDATYLDTLPISSGWEWMNEGVKPSARNSLVYAHQRNVEGIFITRPGQLHGEQVASHKIFEITGKVGNDGAMVIPWSLHEVSIQKFRPVFSARGQREQDYDSNTPVLVGNALDKVRAEVQKSNMVAVKAAEGRVYLKLFIDEDGKYAGYRLMKGLGSGYDDAVVNALSRAGFQVQGTGVKSAMIVPFEFGKKNLYAIDLAVARFEPNPDKKNYCNLMLEVVNKSGLTGQKIGRYMTYIYIDNKLVSQSLNPQGNNKSWLQSRIYFAWHPAKPGMYEYKVLIDPEQNLPDADRSNNVLTGKLYVE